MPGATSVTARGLGGGSASTGPAEAAAGTAARTSAARTRVRLMAGRQARPAGQPRLGHPGRPWRVCETPPVAIALLAVALVALGAVAVLLGALRRERASVAAAQAQAGR